jgi:hypothetical protein
MDFSMYDSLHIIVKIPTAYFLYHFVAVGEVAQSSHHLVTGDKEKSDERLC